MARAKFLSWALSVCTVASVVRALRIFWSSSSRRHSAIPRAQIPRGALDVGWTASLAVKKLLILLGSSMYLSPARVNVFPPASSLWPCREFASRYQHAFWFLVWSPLPVDAHLLQEVLCPLRAKPGFCEWANNWMSLPVCTWAHFLSSLCVSLRVYEIWPFHGLPERGRKTSSQTFRCLLLCTACPWHKASSPCQTHRQQFLPADISSSSCPQCLLL